VEKYVYIINAQFVITFCLLQRYFNSEKSQICSYDRGLKFVIKLIILDEKSIYFDCIDFVLRGNIN
jgi:hypothetical protein